MGMYLFANVVFVVLGSADVQPWDSQGMEKSKKDDVENRTETIRKLSVPLSIH